MSQSVTTLLYIGGEERQASDTLAVADPAKPGAVVGYCAAASKQDVSDAVAAAKSAYPAWAALSPQQRAAQMLAALTLFLDIPCNLRERTERLPLGCIAVGHWRLFAPTRGLAREILFRVFRSISKCRGESQAFNRAALQAAAALFMSAGCNTPSFGLCPLGAPGGTQKYSSLNASSKLRPRLNLVS